MLRQGPGDGEFYSADSKAKRWAGEVVIQATGNKSKDEAKSIIATWIKNGVLERGTYTSPERRENAGCITVNEVKAAEIVRPIYHPASDE